jgi:hypothetical protein
MVVPVLAVALASGVTRAGAAQVTLESRTYLPMYEDGNSKKHVTPYEYLDVDAEDLGTPGLFVRVGGWGRVDLATESYDKKSNSEFQYGFLGWRAPRSNAELRLGRIAVTAGAARNEVFDGAQAGSDLPAGFDVLAYGGVPVETDTGGRSGDSLYGGRLSQGVAGIYRLGVSYLKEKNDKATARDEAGLDVWVRPLLPLAISGSSLYNNDEKKFSRHAYSIGTEPLFHGLRLTARYSWTDYRTFFTGTENSPFVFPAVDPDERLRTLGGDVEIPIAAGFTLTGDYTNYDYAIAATANRYGARLDWAGKAGTSAGIGYHRCQGDAAENRYDEYSAFGSAHLGRVAVSGLLQEVRYGEEISGTRDAFTATLAADTSLSPALSLGADVEYGSNPDFKSEVRGMLKLTWRYAADTAAKGGTAK